MTVVKASDISNKKANLEEKLINTFTNILDDPSKEKRVKSPHILDLELIVKYLKF